MNFYKYFHQKILKIVQDLAAQDNILLKEINFNLEVPKNEFYGDVATNAAMVLSKSFNKPVLELAEIFKEKFKQIPEFQSIEVVKPGFINIVIKDYFWQNMLKAILDQGKNYGRDSVGDELAKENELINVEYVSANPTGPLHIGHGRGAVIGDIIANLYRFLGFKVIKEYYINDAGNQVNILANSLYFRYLEYFAAKVGKQNLENFKNLYAPEGKFYPGEYLVAAADKLAKSDKNKWLNVPEKQWHPFFKKYALDTMLNLIKADLALIDIKQDVFSSEQAIATGVAYDEIIADFSKRDLIYKGTLNPPKGKIIEDFEPREQKLFRSTQFGDDIDRPLEKNDGEKTYFANDLVYHNDKLKRGATKLINVLGADHIGYVKRIQFGVMALSHNKVKLEVICCQLINLLDNNLPIKMSKRAGNFVTLKDLVENVGKDIFRFMMIVRKNDMPIDFDLAKIKEQTIDNPIFYIQYAYARVNSVFKNAQEVFPDIKEQDLSYSDFSLLTQEYELNLLKSLCKLPKILEITLQYNDPHKLYLFLMEISKNFHSLWNKGKEGDILRFIVRNNKNLTISRLSLLKAVSFTIANILNILGVNIRESM
ncbi:Arginine--tRNA ligase [Candidatus Hepatincolaceae symbiont of Richtersius coronifer]